MKSWKFTAQFPRETTAQYLQVNYLESASRIQIIFPWICFFRFDIAFLNKKALPSQTISGFHKGHVKDGNKIIQNNEEKDKQK